MNFLSVLLLSLALSADAFTIALCIGLGKEKPKIRQMTETALWFGTFQFGMTLAGYYISSVFSCGNSVFSAVISFFLLAAAGINMIYESRKDIEITDSEGIKKMFILSFASSIDAFAAGAALNSQTENIIPVASAVGIITFILSVFGVKAGSMGAEKYKNKAKITGGILLIALAVKNLTGDFL